MSEIPFGLVYDLEVVASMDIAVASHRVTNFEVTFNDEQICVELDLVEAKRWTLDKLQGNRQLVTTRFYNR